MPLCLRKTEESTDDRNGEKLLLVSHPKLDMDTILAFTSLWWFTDTYPSSIYPYRQVSTFSLPISLSPCYCPNVVTPLSGLWTMKMKLMNSSWGLKWVNPNLNQLNHLDILISPTTWEQHLSSGSRRKSISFGQGNIRMYVLSSRLG